MPRPKGAVTRPRASKRTAEKQGGIERLRADDPRVAQLLSDEHKRRLAADPNYSFDVEFSPVRASSRGGRTTLAPTRIIEMKHSSTGHPVDIAMRDFKIAVDEDAFMSACSLEPPDSKWARLYTALLRPGAQFSQVIKKEGISLFELNQFWLDSQQHRGIIEMANDLPAALRQTSKAALEKTVTCRKCNGTQSIVVEERQLLESKDGKLSYGDTIVVRRACPECVDSVVPGTVVLPGDIEKLKILFNVTGVMRNSGTSTSVNFDNRTINVGAVEGEVSAIGRILERKPAQLVSSVAAKEDDPDA